MQCSNVLKEDRHRSRPQLGRGEDHPTFQPSTRNYLSDRPVPSFPFFESVRERPTTYRACTALSDDTKTYGVSKMSWVQKYIFEWNFDW